MERAPSFSPNSEEVMRLLADWKSGDRAALDRLMPIVYGEMRRLAAYHLKNERPGHTLQPTALIHEAYLRLMNQEPPTVVSAPHFYSVASQVMRQVLVDFARSRKAAKRGAGNQAPLEEASAMSEQRADELLALDEALDRLKALDERKARVIELRFFGGFQREEIASALALTLATVKRDLILGEAWLRRELTGGTDGKS
jgi:RNA polymerase sigma factor (TIGR02999 family)